MSGEAVTNGGSQVQEQLNGASKQGTKDSGPEQAVEPVSGNSQEQSGAGTVSRAQLEEITDAVNEVTSQLDRNIELELVEVDDDGEQILQANVVDPQSEEVIRSIPPDGMIELRKRLNEFIGVFLDEMS